MCFVLWDSAKISSLSLDTLLKSSDHEIRPRNAQTKTVFLWTLDVVGRAVVSFVDQTYTTAWGVNEGLLFPDGGHSRSSMHWSWFQYVLLNCSCNSSFLMLCFESVIKTHFTKSIQTKEHLRKHAYTQRPFTLFPFNFMLCLIGVKRGMSLWRTTYICEYEAVWRNLQQRILSMFMLYTVHFFNLSICSSIVIRVRGMHCL